MAASMLCMASANTLAANLKVAPSLTLAAERTSNVANVSTGSSYDYIFRAIPKLALTLETPQSALTLSGGADFEEYAHFDELSANPATKYASLASASPISLTSRFSVSPSFRFIESVDATRRNEITQVPIEDVPPSETVVTQRTKTRQYEGSVRMNYKLTPTTETSVSGGGVKREFPDGPSTLIGSRTLTGSASVNWQARSTFRPGLFFETTYNSFDRGPVSAEPNTRTYTAGLTGRYRLTERFSLEGRAGATYVLEKTGIDHHSDHEWEPNARLSLAYVARDFQATLFGSYEVAGAGSGGNTTKRGTVSLSLVDRFVEKWWWDLSGAYQTNRSIGGAATAVIVTEDGVIGQVATEDVETATGTGGIRYDAARWASIRLSGSILRQWSHGLVGDDLKRQSILLSLTLSDVYQIF